MHIVLYSPGWPVDKFQSGIVTFVHWMRLEFERLGHRVTIVTSSKHADCADPRVYAVRPPLIDRLLTNRFPYWKSKYDVANWGILIAAQVSRIQRREAIDVMEMEESFGWFEDVGKIVSIPLLVKLHGPAFLTLTGEQRASAAGQQRLALEERRFKSARAIAAPSATAIDQTLREYSLRPDVSEQVVNPLEMPESTPRWSLESCDAESILFVGRFDLPKGGDLIIQAFAKLLVARPTLRLVFVGPDVGIAAPDGSRVGIEEYCSKVIPAPLRPQVVYKGPLPQSELITLRATARVTVLPSRWENQSYAILEAMYQGCPVVCSDAGGNPELVQDGYNGFLFSSGDASSLALRLSDMIADDEASIRMGSAASQCVRDRHSLKRVAERSVEIYERVIANYRSVINS